MTEQLANNSDSTLSASMASGDTSLTVADGNRFPSAGNFRLIIDGEYILAGARSGNTISSLTRGIEGTVASPHASGTVVTHGLTKGGLDQYLLEHTGGVFVPTLTPKTYDTLLSSAQLLDLHNTPVVIVPGESGKVIAVVGCAVIYKFGTAAYTGDLSSSWCGYGVTLAEVNANYYFSPLYTAAQAQIVNRTSDGYLVPLMGGISQAVDNTIKNAASIVGKPVSFGIMGGSGSALAAGDGTLRLLTLYTVFPA